MAAASTVIEKHYSHASSQQHSQSSAAQLLDRETVACCDLPKAGGRVAE